MLELAVAHAVVAIDREARDGLAAIDRQRRTEVAAIVQRAHVEADAALAELARQAHATAQDLAAGAFLPTLLPARRDMRRDVPARERAVHAEATAVLREVTAAERERALARGRAVREHLHHAGERGDAVQRTLRALHDLDALDVIDRDLRERRIERTADRHTVDRDEQRVELLEPPHPDVGEVRAVVGAATGLDTGDVDERVGERARAALAQFATAHDGGRIGDLDGIATGLGGGHHDAVATRVMGHRDGVGISGGVDGDSEGEREHGAREHADRAGHGNSIVGNTRILRRCGAGHERSGRVRRGLSSEAVLDAAR